MAHFHGSWCPVREGTVTAHLFGLHGRCCCCLERMIEMFTVVLVGGGNGKSGSIFSLPVGRTVAPGGYGNRLLCGYHAAPVCTHDAGCGGYS